MPSTQFAVQTNALARSFKETRAVDGLNLDVRDGELFGLIGPDGAGKTTTLRLLAGLLTVSAGTAQVLGHDLKREAEAIKPSIGYMAQQFSLYGELSVLENLLFFAEIFEIDPAELDGRVARLLEFAGLTHFSDRRAAHLSGGMQKKLALACTLIHEPKLLLLDEPTTGVDPVSRREFWNILADLHARGSTIIVSTPYMDEADRCSMVGLMNAGKLIRCDTPENLRAQVPGSLLDLHCSDWRKAKQLLSAAPGILELQTYGDRLHLLVDNEKQRKPEIKALLEQSAIQIDSLQSAPTRMEESFISIMRSLDNPAEV